MQKELCIALVDCCHPKLQLLIQKAARNHALYAFVTQTKTVLLQSHYPVLTATVKNASMPGLVVDGRAVTFQYNALHPDVTKQSG